MFKSAKIIKTELTKNSQNVITKIHLTVQLQDTTIADTKEFNYIVDGEKLDEIRGDIKSGILQSLKEKTKQNHEEWLKEIEKEIETISDLTSSQIIEEFGIDEIAQLT